ncbi:MAG: hypothetical protein IKX27_00925 [Oscillospiraceae bacterium]|nr:hypothetical protein [Oscillospiraceae bacterium]
MELYLAHVGVNPENAKEVQALRDLLRLGLGMSEPAETPLSWFAADGKIEVMKEKGFGTKGHLAFYTPDLPTTISELEKLGYRFDLSTAKYNPDGAMRLIYLDREINGFAIHMTTRK